MWSVWWYGSCLEIITSLSSICYGNSKFIVTGNSSNNIFAYSNDGINWTNGISNYYTNTINITKFNYNNTVFYDGYKFRILENNSLNSFYTTDGSTYSSNNIDIPTF